jgi:hypothetical protein
MKEKQVFYQPAYWKNTYEVDFIYEDQEPVPVEIKYKNHPTDIKGVIEFIKKFDAKKGIIVTEDTFKKEIIENMEIWFIPVWVYLLILS